jgi:Zn-dependent metalloprotease
MQGHLRSRRRLTVAAVAVASLAITPAAAAATHAGPDGPDRSHGHHADVAAQHRLQAKARHRAKALTPAQNRTAMATARDHAPAVADRLGLPHGERLVVKDVLVDHDGTTHTRYLRTLDGLAVIGGDLVVHQAPGGAITSVDKAHHGSVVPGSVEPALSRAQARSRADHRVAFDAAATSAHLVVYAGAGQPRLAWDAVVSGVRADQTPSRMHVVIDARNGRTLTRWDEVVTADTGTGHSIYSGTVGLGTTSSGSGYQLKDGNRGGNYTTNLNHAETGTGTLFTDSDNTWGNGSQSDPASAAVDAHYGAAMTWDYYLNRHGRRGIFDNGQGVPSRVHYGNGYQNAFWDGQQMTYGDGYQNQDPLVELDVAGHEMSHGVTEASAGLEYTGDAGGLNESTSDIFGTAVEWYANNADDVPDYLIGEEIDINGNGTPLRYMDRPSRDGGSYDCWSSSVGNADPHYSSGPGNHWFYLASEGSGAKTINGVSYNSPTCNGSTVSGIGHAAVEDIWYRALTTYMTSTETYPQARDDSIRAAVDLYGADSTQCRGIEAAWSAVAVPAGAVSCSGGGGGNPPPSGCTALPNTFTGSLAYAGDYAYEPGSQGFDGYYYSASAGTHAACLDGPAGTDFDLYLQKYDGSQWVTVAQSTSSSSHEEISYSGAAGYYSYVVQSYSGSGSYTLRLDAP